MIAARTCEPLQETLADPWGHRLPLHARAWRSLAAALRHRSWQMPPVRPRSWLQWLSDPSQDRRPPGSTRSRPRRRRGGSSWLSGVLPRARVRGGTPSPRRWVVVRKRDRRGVVGCHHHGVRRSLTAVVITLAVSTAVLTNITNAGCGVDPDADRTHTLAAAFDIDPIVLLAPTGITHLPRPSIRSATSPTPWSCSRVAVTGWDLREVRDPAAGEPGDRHRRLLRTGGPDGCRPADAVGTDHADMSWVPHHRRQWLAPDALAGLAVAAVAIPTAMGYLQWRWCPCRWACTRSPAALILYAIFGSSRQVSVDRPLTVALMSGAVIAGMHGIQDPARAAALTAGVALAAGAWLALFGILRLDGSPTSSRVRSSWLCFGLGITVITGELSHYARDPVDVHALRRK